MSFVEWLVLLSTIFSVSFAWGTYLVHLYSTKNQPEKLKEDEERLIQLMGRAKTFVDSKLEILEQKMKEVNDLISEINDLYSKVLLDMSQLKEKNRQKTQENIIKEEKIILEEKNEIKKEPKTEKTMEEKIIELYNNGTSEAEIAKKFGIGIGEVRLIIDLFLRSKGGQL
ncbi:MULTISPECIES: DUF6115 domain-containing protein [unclassified Thermosipho (in: thermotogales)]|uniref:DUF6115 domain-containing protein n=1 Tax=unclassified Thermosipho (in: thermotogales) TaxID=2676525 RepID=UPI000986CAA5|nr:MULTISPECIES: DUF6115 domain-containing protein [unclassified Thermosipho (in: thermotogales)]MBT1248068.1 hypothetical protein [Thermosipho sp. 1244]OOC46659.1 hypothetical protein XO09_05840 [Thermosipho sp. 1223]